jgi:hypothetical protein
MTLRAHLNPIRHLWLTIQFGCVCASVLLAGGCRQRAFNELYAESLAREIREVEDLVYEFEAENREMEWEIEDLRRVNAQLQSRLKETQGARVKETNTGSASSGMGVERKSLLDGVVPSDRSKEGSGTPNPSSILKSPPPLQLPSSKDKSGGNEAMDLEMPEIVIPKKVSPNAASGPVQGRPALPSVAPADSPRIDAGDSNSGSIPKPSGPKPSGVGAVPTESTSPGALTPGAIPIPNGEIQVPKLPIPGFPDSQTLPPGRNPSSELLPADEAQPLIPRSNQPVKTKEPLHKPAPMGLPEDVSEAVLRERRIYTPPMPEVIRASATAAPKPDSTSVVDRNVRGIDFHPTLCRGHNVDGQPGHGGLTLVLLTLNAKQQFVPGEGELTIVAEEPTAEGGVNRIGRWEIPPEQLQDGLEPIGAAQGFHLKLPWQDRKPEGLSVDVYVRLVLADGTKMVNRKTIHLRKPNNAPSTWTPR